MTTFTQKVQIRPLHVNTPRRTAYAHQKAAKEELDSLVHLGIIEKVHGESQWISPMSFAAKPDGGMRLVADLVHLNKHIKRLIHPFMSLKDIINQSESDAKYFATLDAKSGYQELELDKESRKYTCFIMEWGRAPMGLVS